MERKTLLFLFALIAINLIILGIGNVIDIERIKTNEALIHMLNERVEMQKQAVLTNSAVLLTFMQDPYLVQVWNHSIHNPSNRPYIIEIAFNLGIPADSITQLQFDQRYLIDQIQQRE